MEQKEKKTIENSIKEFSIVCYQPLTQEDIIDLGITRWAFILHDKDLKEDGTSKEPHYHYYIKIPARKRISTLINYFKKYETTFRFEKCNNTATLLRYFIHYNEEDKTQYNKEEIYSNFDIEEYFNPSTDNEDYLKQITILILNGEIKTYIEIVQHALEHNQLELVSKKAFYFKNLL